MSDPGIQPATVKQYCGMLSTYRLVVSCDKGGLQGTDKHSYER